MRTHRLRFKPTISQVFTFGIGCLAIVLILNLTYKSVDCRKKQIEKEIIAVEVTELTDQVDSLRETLTETERQTAIEQSLREDFGLVGENEETVILQFEEAPAEALPTPPSDTTHTVSTSPHWIEWVSVFLPF